MSTFRRFQRNRSGPVLDLFLVAFEVGIPSDQIGLKFREGLAVVLRILRAHETHKEYQARTLWQEAHGMHSKSQVGADRTDICWHPFQWSDCPFGLHTSLLEGRKPYLCGWLHLLSLGRWQKKSKYRKPSQTWMSGKCNELAWKSADACFSAVRVSCAHRETSVIPASMLWSTPAKPWSFAHHRTKGEKKQAFGLKFAKEWRCRYGKHSAYFTPP